MTSPIPPEPAAERHPPTCWLTDMDGVLLRQGRALPGAADFLARELLQRPLAALTPHAVLAVPDLRWAAVEWGPVPAMWAGHSVSVLVPVLPSR